jgi:hypothetical protein
VLRAWPGLAGGRESGCIGGLGFDFAHSLPPNPVWLVLARRLPGWDASASRRVLGAREDEGGRPTEGVTGS